MESAIGFLVDRVSELDDPRQAGKVQYPLAELVVLTVVAIMADCDSWEDVAEFGRDRLEWLRKFLPFEHGIPSHDTLARVFSVIGVESLEACASEWVTEAFVSPGSEAAVSPEPAPREVVPVDGKTLRRSHDRRHEQSALHVVSAYAAEAGVTLGQTAVAEKSNEITAIPRLVQALSLVNCIVTIDAMGCQTEIARVLVDCGADYVLAVKGNQPGLQQAVIEFFEAMEQHEDEGVEFQHVETVEQRRGRQERRLYWTAPVPESLSVRGEWTGLRTLGMVISERTLDGQTSSEVRYYISSLENNVSEFSRAVRAHWLIENRLHWSLDVVFREDDSRMRIGHSARVFTLLRKLAMNLLHRARGAKKSLRARRKKAARNPDYLLELLTSV